MNWWEVIGLIAALIAIYEFIFSQKKVPTHENSVAREKLSEKQYSPPPARPLGIWEKACRIGMIISFFSIPAFFFSGHKDVAVLMGALFSISAGGHMFAYNYSHTEFDEYTWKNYGFRASKTDDALATQLIFVGSVVILLWTIYKL